MAFALTDPKKWEADLQLTLPSGEFYRERIVSTATGKTAASTWARARKAQIIVLASQGLTTEQIRCKLQLKEVDDGPAVPTVSEFKGRFIEHGKANKQKASTLYAKESILRRHLVPALGTKRLDEITEAGDGGGPEAVGGACGGA